jgi:hypothetical protein
MHLYNHTHAHTHIEKLLKLNNVFTEKKCIENLLEPQN